MDYERLGEGDGLSISGWCVEGGGQHSDLLCLRCTYLFDS